MMINRTLAVTALLYILCILILPWLIPGKAMNHIWNPFSLLHIPLYGALMALLSFTFKPGLLNAGTTAFYPSSLLLPGGIAFLTGALDEANQIFIPGRHASIMDLLLNIGGIVLSGLAIYFWHKQKKKIGNRRRP